MCRDSVRKKLAYLAVAGLALTPYTSQSHSGPTPEQRAELDTAEDAPERIQFARRLHSYRFGESLRQKVVRKIFHARLQAFGLSPSDQALALFRNKLLSLPYPPELQSEGDKKSVTILVDFKDVRAATKLPGLTADLVSKNIYGAGTQTAKDRVPYESVHEYYRRASGGKLDYTGDVIGWVHLSKARCQYEPQTPAAASDDERYRLRKLALFNLFSETLDAVNSSVDFTKYDNDNDGDIDLVTIIYIGPRGEWMQFWWDYQWSFDADDPYSKTVDRKKLRQFIFASVCQREGDCYRRNADFEALTLIHETGHAFGLPDYYDACSVDSFDKGDCGTDDHGPGPDGGLGQLDMMDADWGNHNAFSRWLLDWIVPTFIPAGQQKTMELVPSGADIAGAKAVAIFPGLKPTDVPGQELFLIENRTRVGNDGDTPGDGLIIWHIDATVNLDNTDFRFDNSFTTPKLIRMVRRRNETDFKDGEWASADDYFGPSDEFSPNTKPNSNGNTGEPTGVFVGNIVKSGDNITVNVGFGGRAPDAAAPQVAISPPLPTNLPSSTQLSQVGPSTPAATPPIDLLRLRQLDEDFGAATSEELAKLWENRRPSLNLEAPATESTMAAELLLVDLARKDGAEAVRILLELGDTPFTRRVFPQAMQAWVFNDPKGAADWYLAPAQAQLRSHGALIAGEQFARRLFRWRGGSNAATAALAIDQLNNATEIYGAIEGLREAAVLAERDPKTIETELEALTVRSQKALSLSRLRSAIEGGSQHIETLRGASQPAIVPSEGPSELFLQERLRALGAQ